MFSTWFIKCTEQDCVHGDRQCSCEVSYLRHPHLLGCCWRAQEVGLQWCHIRRWWLFLRRETRRKMFYLTTHSTHFIYGYMASDIWLRTILIVRKETRCRHIGYFYRLTARVLLYAPSHRQGITKLSVIQTRGLFEPILSAIEPQNRRICTFAL